MLRVGLTGGVGCGKSIAAEYFMSLGVPAIDADEVSRYLVEPDKPAYGQVVQLFGREILQDTNEIDRSKLRTIIFTDARQRVKLESILHPLIREEMERRIIELDYPYVILMIPLLVETGQIDIVDKIIVVDLPEHLQIQRAAGRDEMTVAEVESVLRAQADSQTRKATADYIIDNSQDLEYLYKQIEALHESLFDLGINQQAETLAAVANELSKPSPKPLSNELASLPPKKTVLRSEVVMAASATKKNRVTGASHIDKRDPKAVTGESIYELPLNERIRSFIRLENIFKEIEHSLKGDDVWDSRSAVHGVVTLLNVFARPDLKNDLLKEVERINAKLNVFAEVSGVDEGYLQNVQNELAQLTKGFYGIDGPLGCRLKHNEFLASIKQREMIPGGTFSVDLPYYGYWLSKEAEERKENIQQWLSEFNLVKRAVNLIMDLIRESATPISEIACAGYYQKTLDTNQSYQLVRVILPNGYHYYPEISGGRQRFTVRFLQSIDFGKPSQLEQTINFRLACCSL